MLACRSSCCVPPTLPDTSLLRPPHVTRRSLARSIPTCRRRIQRGSPACPGPIRSHGVLYLASVFETEPRALPHQASVLPVSGSSAPTASFEYTSYKIVDSQSLYHSVLSTSLGGRLLARLHFKVLLRQFGLERPALVPDPSAREQDAQGQASTAPGHSALSLQWLALAQGRNSPIHLPLGT